MKMQQSRPIIKTKSNIAFQKKAVLEGQGLENLIKTLGEGQADNFIKKVSSSVQNLSNLNENAILKFDESSISGNKVSLRGKYVDNHSVENISITLNKKATANKTLKQLTRFFKRFEHTDIFS